MIIGFDVSSRPAFVKGTLDQYFASQYLHHYYLTFRAHYFLRRFNEIHRHSVIGDEFLHLRLGDRQSLK